MIDKSERFDVGEMVRFEGTHLLQTGDTKNMVMTTIPRVGVIVKALDLDAMGIKHQVLEIFSDNEVCIVRTGMPDTVVRRLKRIT